jgi:hypothetical protein
VFLLFKLVKPLVLVLVLAAVWLFAPPIGSVNGEALHRNVVRELDGTADIGAKTCSKRGTITWRCRVYAPAGSDPTTYSVRLDGRCWTARRTAGPAALATRAEGCLHLRDQVYALAGIG